MMHQPSSSNAVFVLLTLQGLLLPFADAAAQNYDQCLNVTFFDNSVEEICADITESTWSYAEDGSIDESPYHFEYSYTKSPDGSPPNINVQIPYSREGDCTLMVVGQTCQRCTICETNLRDNIFLDASIDADCSNMVAPFDNLVIPGCQPLQPLYFPIDPTMPELGSNSPSFAPTVAEFIDTDDDINNVTNGTFIYTASFTVDIRAQYPGNNITVCDPAEWTEILMVSEHCLNTHYFDSVPEGIQNVTFVMDGFDKSLFVDRTNKTFNDDELQFLANNKSYTKRLNYPPVLKQRMLNFQFRDDDNSGSDHEVKIAIPPTRVYEVDNTTDCEYRSFVNKCHGPSDACMFACGKGIPIALRSDINATELANNTEAITNSKYLPISQWQSLRKHLGMCLRGYVEYTGTKCLGYKDKLVVEMDVVLDKWDPNVTSTNTTTAVKKETAEVETE